MERRKMKLLDNKSVEWYNSLMLGCRMSLRSERACKQVSCVPLNLTPLSMKSAPSSKLKLDGN